MAIFDIVLSSRLNACEFDRALMLIANRIEVDNRSSSLDLAFEASTQTIIGRYHLPPKHRANWRAAAMSGCVIEISRSCHVLRIYLSASTSLFLHLSLANPGYNLKILSLRSRVQSETCMHVSDVSINSSYSARYSAGWISREVGNGLFRQVHSDTEDLPSR